MPARSSPGRSPVQQRRILRLALRTIVLVPAILCCAAGWAWIPPVASAQAVREAGVGFLNALEVAYGVALLCAALGVMAFGLLFVLGRRRSLFRSSLARGLLLCVSFVLACGAAESISAAWRSWTRRDSTLPAAGVATTGRELPVAGFATVAHSGSHRDFPDPPGDRTIDLVVLGESSAWGAPFHDWLSIGKIVAWQLERALPQRPIRLTVLARPGDTLEVQHHDLLGLEHRPDLMIIYCGHNEFDSRIWWCRDTAHYRPPAPRPRWELWLERARSVSCVDGLIQEARARCLIALPPPSTVRRPLVDMPAFTPEEHARLLADFRRRLEAMVAFARSAGAIAVLIAPPANDAGYEPNRSFLPGSTTQEQRDAFRQAFLDARNEEARDAGASIALYRALLAQEPGFAETHYRLARLLETQGEWDEAYEHYVAARDLDGYPTRCLSAFQEVYREVAARHACILVDGQAYFHAIGHHGLLDDDLFEDAMHPSLRGHVALAQAVLKELKTRRSFGWPEGVPAPVIDPARCAAHFGMKTDKDWIGICHWVSGFYGLVRPMRYEPAYRSRMRLAYLAAERRLAAGASAASIGLRNVGMPPPVPLVDTVGPPRPIDGAPAP
jgi:lysophospholipase L1-like esterase